MIKPRKTYFKCQGWGAVGKMGNLIAKGFHILYNVYRSRIHERTISLTFLGIILGVLRLEVSVWNS
jgi:hypothetical protein